MKTTFIQNGKLSLAITPETEIEKQLLAELFKSPVDSQIHEKLQVLDKALVDSVVITTKIAIT
jgi:hypothetical protein